VLSVWVYRLLKTTDHKRERGVGVQNLLKANDGSLHGGEGLVFIALHSEGWR